RRARADAGTRLARLPAPHRRARRLPARRLAGRAPLARPPAGADRDPLLRDRAALDRAALAAPVRDSPRVAPGARPARLARRRRPRRRPSVRRRRPARLPLRRRRGLSASGSFLLLEGALARAP